MERKFKDLELFLETPQIDNATSSFNRILDGFDIMGAISGLFQTIQDIQNINANKEMTIEKIKAKKEILLRRIETKHIEVMTMIENNHKERSRFLETCMYTVRESIAKNDFETAIKILEKMSEVILNNKEK